MNDNTPHNTPRGAAFSLTLALSALVACTGSQKPAEDPGDAAGASEPVPSGEKAWADKSREERMDWMGLEDFPKMKAEFTEHDAEGLADFACQTCHGDDMEAMDFKMPNSLYALSATDTLAEARDYDAEMTEVMVNVVVPEMAKLLGMQPYDPATQTGFGCFGCHPTEDG
jgi:hypothetical protein